MFAPDLYVAALELAAERHRGQLITGTQLPYLVHVVSVTAELTAALSGSGLDPDLAIPCALLHDTVEDTAKTDSDKAALAAEIARLFGERVRDGVLALSKREQMPDGTEIPKPERMADSLRRIRDQPHEVWAVKLADRITNLAPPPRHWTVEKRIAYRAEAGTILDTLGAASAALAARIQSKIDAYEAHCR